MEPVKMDEIPTEVLSNMARKSFDWVLAHLQAETLFDTEAIAVLLSLGKQAIQDELESRLSWEREGMDCEPVIVPSVNELGDSEVDAALASLFGGVLDVSIEGSVVAEEEQPAAPNNSAFDFKDMPDIPNVQDMF